MVHNTVYDALRELKGQLQDITFDCDTSASYRDRVRSSVIRKGLRDTAPLHREESVRHLVRRPPGCLPNEVLQGSLTGRMTQNQIERIFLQAGVGMPWITPEVLMRWLWRGQSELPC